MTIERILKTLTIEIDNRMEYDNRKAFENKRVYYFCELTSQYVQPQSLPFLFDH